MTADVVELFKKASDLSEKDRATLAGLLIESHESERDNDVEAAWIEEVERRIAELDSGAVEAIPWEEVKAKLLRRLNDSQG
jgi:putative addiction module component (TIGR02574 family)